MDTNLSAREQRIKNLQYAPEEMTSLDQWVCWDKNKHPFNARTGKRANVNDPDTWCSFEEAKAALINGKYEGVGFVLREDDPFVIIDLDNARDPETGEVDPCALEVIRRMDSYTEISQSGRGFHIIVKGKKPGRRCKFDFRDHRVEVYDGHHYFALTFLEWESV